MSLQLEVQNMRLVSFEKNGTRLSVVRLKKTLLSFLETSTSVIEICVHFDGV